MAKGYNAPAEVRELEKQINDFTYRNGLDVKTVFQDLLRYIVHGFSLPDTPPLSDWRYNKEQTKVFYDMFATWIQIMSQQIKRHGWYDAFGDLFMALTSQSGQQQKGQFFTPAHITDLMSKITMGKQESDAKILSVCDPTAGSGRTLFCIDSLRMDNFRGAWIVNEALCRTGLPTVRKLDEKEYNLFKQADIPPYVFFINQKGYDDYFRMRETWAKVMSLFQESPTPQTGM